MVLGGLLKDEFGGSVDQVPVLGDLPILGPLFRTETRSRTKSNLMVFLRPMVMRDAGRIERAVAGPLRPDPRAAADHGPAAAERGDADQRRAGRAGAAGTDTRLAAAARRGAAAAVDAAAVARGKRTRARSAAGTAAAGPRPALPALRPMGTRHPLPYAFAKANTLLLEDDGTQRVLWVAETTSAGALSEVTRLFDVNSFEREAAATLGAPHRGRLRRRRIERRSGHRRGRRRGRPEPADAGPAGRRGPARSEQRRADHPHAQRAADAGGEGRRQRHPHRALRAQQRGALPRRRQRCARWSSPTGRCTRR